MRIRDVHVRISGVSCAVMSGVVRSIRGLTLSTGIRIAIHEISQEVLAVDCATMFPLHRHLHGRGPRAPRGSCWPR